MTRWCTIIAAAFLGLVLNANTAFAGQPLETESARILDKGKLEFDGTFEYQTSSEGWESAFPMLIEYGLTRRLELAMEPVAGTDIHPNTGRRARGAGDLEATLTYLVGSETSRRPAIAFAAEIKFPTAKDRLIGSGKTDLAGYAIASRRFSHYDVHANIGYTVLGEPAGVKLNNIFSFAAAVEYHISPRWDWVAEGFANTIAAPGLGEGNSSGTVTEQTAELAGGEAFAMLGARWHVSRGISLAFGVVYDNNNAILFRPGITGRF